MCENRECLANVKDYTCDGVNHCVDGSDEKYCGKITEFYN